MKIRTKVFIHENMYESVCPWKYAWKTSCISRAGVATRPLCMGVLYVKWLHITLQGLLLLATPSPPPTSNWNLLITHLTLYILCTIPSTLRTLGVHNLTLKIAHCILHTEHFIQQCMIVKNVYQFCTISIYCDCLQHVNWTVAWSNCSICCKFILYLQYVCVDQTAGAIKVI